MKADIKIKDADIKITDKDSCDDKKLSFWQLLEGKTCDANNECAEKCKCKKECKCTIPCKKLIKQEQEKIEKCYFWKCFIELCRCILCNCLLCKDRLEKKPITAELKKCLLTQYLNNVVPDWREMKEDRLYKHIQRTLDNAEQIRRFEIELVWKRSVYMVGLLLLTFTGFAWTIQDEAMQLSSEIKELMLLALAIVNTVFSFFFWMMNFESKAWQRNWECHADYLQELVGARMMRTLFRKKACLFSIGKINIFIGSFLTMSWFCVSFFILIYNKCPFFDSLAITESKWYLVLLFLLIAIASYFINCLMSKCNFAEGDALFSDVKTSPLSRFDFSKLDLEKK